MVNFVKTLGLNMKKYLKEAIILALMVFIVTNVVSYYKSSSVNAKDSYKLLNSYSSIDGKSIKDLLQSNKVLVVNFWGTWCPVCNQEISNIAKIAKDSEVVLVTIAVNSGTNEEIKSYLQSKGVDFLVVNDTNGKLAKAFNISTYPTTIFYSPNRAKIIKDSGYLSWGGYLARKKLVEQ